MLMNPSCGVASLAKNETERDQIDQRIEAMNESNQELSDMRIRLHRIEDLLEKIEQK